MVRLFIKILNKKLQGISELEAGISFLHNKEEFTEATNILVKEFLNNTTEDEKG
jgi:hypothetical protein